MLVIVLLVGFVVLIQNLSAPAQCDHSVPFTLAIIKPDAYSRKEELLNLIRSNDLAILAIDDGVIPTERAEALYTEHAQRTFYPQLMKYMTSGPSVRLVLAKITHSAGPTWSSWRALMGPTDPTLAPSNTIRALYGQSKTLNAVHGSDSAANAAREISIMFPAWAPYVLSLCRESTVKGA